MIYEEIAATIDHITVDLALSTPNNLSEAILIDHPLLHVCRQLRKEAGSVIKTFAPLLAQTFTIRMRTFDFERLSVLSDYIQAQAKHYSVGLDDCRRFKAVFKLGRDALSSLEATESQLLANSAPDKIGSNPFRFAKLFRVREVTFRFHLWDEAMTPAAKGETVTYTQIESIKRLLGELRDAFVWHEAPVAVSWREVAPIKYSSAFGRAHEALRYRRRWKKLFG